MTTLVRVLTNDTQQEAQVIEFGVRLRATVATPGDEDWYRLELQAGEAIEFDLFDIPEGTEYAVQLVDGDGRFLADGWPVGERVRIGSYAAKRAGSYFLCVYSLYGSDARRSYSLHVDKYRSLEGEIAGEVTLTPEDGPYRLGKAGLTLLPGAKLTLEAGTILNVRSGGQIHVLQGAMLQAAGEARLPIFVLGVPSDRPPRSWLVVAESAQHPTVHLLHILEQQDLLPEQSPLHQASKEVIIREGLYESATPTQVPPSQRPARIRDWYLAASPYRFTLIGGLEVTGDWHDPLRLKRRDVYFGMDVELFTEWEVESGRVTDERFESGEHNYWEFVNSGFLSDMEEASRVSAGLQATSHFRVRRFADYLACAKRWLNAHGVWKVGQLWHLFFNRSEESEWLAHLTELSELFWLSHNTSIVYWDDLARRNGLHAGEDVFEALFINGVIIRVDYTADLNFPVPVFGRNLPPVGLIGMLLHHGPFQYPSVYPAPKPQGDAEQVEVDTAAHLVRAYIQYILADRTNPVFTWWIPTGADAELRRRMREKGLTHDSPLEDWRRELVQPAWKTLLEIRQKYLGDAHNINS